MAAKTKTKSKPAPEPEVDEDEDLELEDLDEDVEEEEGTSKKQEVTFGVNHLIELIQKKTGKEYKPREVRTLLRKMARDGSGRIEREISPENRTRYNWTGPDDPEVKRVLKAVGGGEIEAQKKAALDALKSRKAAQDAASGKVKAKMKGKKVKQPEPEEVDEEDIEDLEDEDE